MGLTQKLGTIPLAISTDASNNVGIGGAANASFKLQVTGTTNLTGALSGTSATFSSSVTAAQLNATTTAAGYAAILTNTNGASDSNGLLVKAASGSSEYNVRFANQTDTSTFFTVKGNGNVGIGTSSPSTLLTIGNAAGSTLSITSNGNAGTSASPLPLSINFTGYLGNICGQIKVQEISGSAQVSNMYFYTYFFGQRLVMSLTQTGNVVLDSLIGTGSRTVTADANGQLSASSDSSLKQEDTNHQIEGLAEILQLQPRAYKWKSDIEIRGEDATTEIGFYANEVNAIIPSAAPKGNDDLFGFYDRAVIAALVKGMQEQNQTIQNLQAQINELKALIAAK